MPGKLLNCSTGIISEQSEQFLSTDSVADDPELGGSTDYHAVLTEPVALSGPDRLRSIQLVPLEPLRRVVAAVAEGLHPGRAGVLLSTRGP